MRNTFKPKSLFILALIAVGMQCAHADSERGSFEDGLRRSGSASFSNAEQERGRGNAFGFGQRFEDEAGERFEHRFNFWHALGHHHHGQDGIGVSPVSEPASDAMLLAGLVAVGAWVRRKNRAA